MRDGLGIGRRFGRWVRGLWRREPRRLKKAAYYIRWLRKTGESVYFSAGNRDHKAERYIRAMKSHKPTRRLSLIHVSKGAAKTVPYI